MALIQPSPRLLFVVLLLSILSFMAAARPCKTLFISSYSIFFHPNSPDQINPSSPRTAGILTIFADIRQFRPRAPLTFLGATEDTQPTERASHFGLGLGFDSHSLWDRTQDVLSVVVALLFGVGCGALIAATMYLGCSLFSNRLRYSDSDYDHFGDDDADMSPKKAGNVKIPPPDVTPLGDVKILPSPPGDASSAGDIKIPPCPALAPPAGDVKIPPSPAYAPPGDASPAGDAKIPPFPADDVKIPPPPPGDGDVKIPRSAPLYLPISPGYSYKVPGYSPTAPRCSPFSPPYGSLTGDASPDADLSPKKASNVKMPPADASPASDAEAPPPARPYNLSLCCPISPSYSFAEEAPLPAVPCNPVSPSYSPSAPSYSASYYYEPTSPPATDAFPAGGMKSPPPPADATHSGNVKIPGSAPQHLPISPGNSNKAPGYSPTAPRYSPPPYGSIPGDASPAADIKIPLRIPPSPPYYPDGPPAAKAPPPPVVPSNHP